MNTAEYLGQARELYERIQKKEEQTNMLRSMAMNTTQSFSDMPHSATRNTHPMENAIIKVISLEEEIDKDKKLLKEMQDAIQATISTVSAHNYRMVLELRYVCCMSWDEISQVMGYTKRHVFRIHETGLTMVVVPESWVAPP